MFGAVRRSNVLVVTRPILARRTVRFVSTKAYGERRLSDVGSLYKPFTACVAARGRLSQIAAVHYSNRYAQFLAGNGRRLVYSLVLCLGPHNSELHGLCTLAVARARHHLSNTQISVYVSLCTLYTSWSPCVLSCAREVRVTASAAYAWHHSVSHIGTCFLQAFGDRKDSERAA